MIAVLTAVAGFCLGALATWLLAGRRRPPSRPADDTVTLVTALMPARTAAEVALVAVEQAQAMWSASVARVAIRRDRDLFEYVADSLPRDVHDEHAIVSARGEDPIALALREHRALYWTSFADFERRHARAAAVLHQGPVASIAILPLEGESEPVGVWVLAFADAQDFPRSQRAELEHASAEVAVALERAMLFEFERSTATELQRSLLGPPVLIEGAGHSARYAPAESTLAVGGDWHDTIPLADGRIGLVVGDVVGRGLQAATVMGQLRSALGACALRSPSAADALDCLDEFAHNIPAAVSTTVAYVIVDIHGRRIQYSSAGHPPPLCVQPDGSYEFLDDAQSRPLVVPVREPGRRTTAERPLADGALLVLYSDGLVERRGESLDAGLQRLVDAVRARVRLPLEHLADQLLDAMRAGGGNDDVVLLLLRAQVLSPTMLLRKAQARPDQLRVLRDITRQWLELAGVPETQATDVLIAVGEACMNVVQHAYGNEQHKLIRLEGAVVDDELIVTITDTGTWKEHSTRSVGGRGLGMMRQLVGSVEISRRTAGTTVTFRTQLQHANL